MNQSVHGFLVLNYLQNWIPEASVKCDKGDNTDLGNLFHSLKKTF